MDSTGTGPDVDAVLTVRELTRQLRSRFVNVDLLDEEESTRRSASRRARATSSA